MKQALPTPFSDKGRIKVNTLEWVETAAWDSCEIFIYELMVNCLLCEVALETFASRAPNVVFTSTSRERVRSIYKGGGSERHYHAHGGSLFKTTRMLSGVPARTGEATVRTEKTLLMSQQRATVCPLSAVQLQPIEGVFTEVRVHRRIKNKAVPVTGRRFPHSQYTCGSLPCREPQCPTQYRAFLLGRLGRWMVVEWLI
jgi:hypothetical protein